VLGLILIALIAAIVLACIREEMREDPIGCIMWVAFFVFLLILNAIRGCDANT